MHEMTPSGLSLYRVQLDQDKLSRPLLSEVREVVYRVRTQSSSYWAWPKGDVGRKQAGIEDLMHWARDWW